jgi:hypothetical protein
VLPIPSPVSTPTGVPTGDVESMWSQTSLPATAMRELAAVPDLTGLLTFSPGDVISGALPAGTVQLSAETAAGDLVDLVTLPASPAFTHTVAPGRSDNTPSSPIRWDGRETWWPRIRPDLEVAAT